MASRNHHDRRAPRHAGSGLVLLLAILAGGCRCPQSCPETTGGTSHPGTHRTSFWASGGMTDSGTREAGWTLRPTGDAL